MAVVYECMTYHGGGERDVVDEAGDERGDPEHDDDGDRQAGRLVDGLHHLRGPVHDPLDQPKLRQTLPCAQKGLRNEMI